MVKKDIYDNYRIYLINKTGYSQLDDSPHN